MRSTAPRPTWNAASRKSTSAIRTSSLETVKAGIADHLLRADQQARWLTERQLRHAQVCDTCAANRRSWRRRPDGVLLSGTHETAIEVETTAKPLEQYLTILDAYAG